MGRKSVLLGAVKLAVVLGLAIGLGSLSQAAAPSGTAKGEWLTWGGDAGFSRYSPLDQISAANVGTMEVAWRWQSLPLGPRPDTSNKSTPIMVGDTLYVPTGAHQVAAINPGTGETKWIYTPPPTTDPGRGLGLGSRSLAYWTDGKAARIFHNTLDGRLLSIDANTGKADPNFGEGGLVVLKKHLMPDGSDAPFVGSSSPATVVGNVVVAQVIADITAPQKEQTPGFIRGFDVRTGKLLWTFHTVPQKGEYGNNTWEGDGWKYTGNTGVWSMMSSDPDLGYIYLPVESPTNDFYGGHRLGDALYGESIVCLDARTGKRVWHFQIVHHGLWDYDPPAAPILHDVVIGGKRIKAVTQLTKQGLAFTFDRKTGKPVWPIEERDAPQIDIPGDKHSKTQPFPTLPEPFSALGYNEDELINFTPELHKQALEIANRYVLGPLYTPTTIREKGGKQGTWVYPSYQGGANWNGAAVDPATGTMFTPIRNTVMNSHIDKGDPAKTDFNYVRPATETVKGPQGLPINRPPWSLLFATNMNTGHHIWQKPIGGAPDEVRNNPALKGLKLDFDHMGQMDIRPIPLATKTLLFMGEAGGLGGDPGGPMFRAYDKATGKVISEFRLPERATGGPMTYLYKGRQYIVVSVASAKYPAELVALSLPGARMPSATAPPPVAPPPAPRRGAAPSAADLDAGKAVYARACAACHGATGEGASAPALTAYSDMAGVVRMVRQGGVEMPALAGVLKAEEIDQVAKFVAAGWRASR
jgi:quinoprotein glucose dehydrogenase